MLWPTSISLQHFHHPFLSAYCVPSLWNRWLSDMEAHYGILARGGPDCNEQFWESVYAGHTVLTGSALSTASSCFTSFTQHKSDKFQDWTSKHPSQWQSLSSILQLGKTDSEPTPSPETANAPPKAPGPPLTSTTTKPFPSSSTFQASKPSVGGSSSIPAPTGGPTSSQLAETSVMKSNNTTSPQSIPDSGSSPAGFQPSSTSSFTPITSSIPIPVAAASNKSKNHTPIIAGVIAPVAFLVLIAAGVLMYKRRQRSRDRREWERTHAAIANAVRQVNDPAALPVGGWNQSRGDLPFPSEKGGWESTEPLFDKSAGYQLGAPLGDSPSKSPFKSVWNLSFPVDNVNSDIFRQ
ncbi:hypothetical protein C8R43DRAFT_518181 [Mycena crocata]|nr:hypothetical protein C8R43DRAFT_518181 [Mycena crocata]